MRESVNNGGRSSSILIRVGVAQGLGYGAALAWNLVLARRVSVDAFGSLTFAFTIMTILQVLLGAGCGQAIVKFRSRAEERAEIPLVALIIPVASAALLVVAIRMFFPNVSGEWRSLSAADYSSVVMMGFSLALFGIAGSVFQARRRPVAAAIMNPTLGAFLILAAVAMTILRDDTLPSTVLGVAASTLIVPAGLIAAWYLFRSCRGPRSAGPWRGDDGFVAFGLKSMTIGLVYMGITHLDRLMLGLMSTTAEVGVYGVAARLVGLMYLVVYLLPPIVAPIYASSGLHRDEAGGRVYETSTALVARIVLPMALLFLLAGGDILSLLAGPEYRDGGGILGVLAVSVFLVAATGNNGLMLQMGGRENWEMGMNLGALLMNITLNLLMIPRWGGLGAAYATAASLFVSTACKTLICRRIWGVTPAVFRKPRYLLAAVSAVAVHVVAASFSGTIADVLALAVAAAVLLRPTAVLAEIRILSTAAGHRGEARP